MTNSFTCWAHLMTTICCAINKPIHRIHCIFFIQPLQLSLLPDYPFSSFALQMQLQCKFALPFFKNIQKLLPENFVDLCVMLFLLQVPLCFMYNDKPYHGSCSYSSSIIFKQVYISNKASRMLGLLKSTLSPCSQNVKSIAYKMLVRPQLEYASDVWNLYTKPVLKKLNKFKEIHAVSSFRNTVKTLTPHFSLTS